MADKGEVWVSYGSRFWAHKACVEQYSNTSACNCHDPRCVLSEKHDRAVELRAAYDRADTQRWRLFCTDRTRAEDFVRWQRANAYCRRILTMICKKQETPPLQVPIKAECWVSDDERRIR